jgi:hypothetical protein
VRTEESELDILIDILEVWYDDLKSYEPSNTNTIPFVGQRRIEKTDGVRSFLGFVRSERYPQTLLLLSAELEECELP